MAIVNSKAMGPKVARAKCDFRYLLVAWLCVIGWASLYVSLSSDISRSKSPNQSSLAPVVTLPQEEHDIGEDYVNDNVGLDNVDTMGLDNVDTTAPDASFYYTELRAKYGVSEREWLLCIEQLRSKIIPSSSTGRSTNNIHDRMQSEIEDLAISSMCATSRRFNISPLPHFGGGRRQFLAYLKARGWTMEHENKTQDALTPPVAYISSCMYIGLRFNHIMNRYALVSATPNERRNALKIPFYKALREYFQSINCDYRTFHPESFLVEEQSTCNELIAAIQNETLQGMDAEEETMWFFKDKRESFGTGVTVRTSAEALEVLDNCRVIKPYFVQRGVPSIVKYKGRVTQGRSYFLFSNLKPATLWLFMGYLNVAAESVDDAPDASDPSIMSPRKGAYVTNTKSNQQSERILLAELLSSHSRSELRMAKMNIRKAALIAFLSLKPKLVEYAPGFSVFGFDYILQSDMSVKVLETNCNCEFFFDEARSGPLRVGISTYVVKGAMDIALASKLNPEMFNALLRKYVEQGNLFDKEESVGLDLSPTKHRRSWELLYTEEVHPPFSVMDLATGGC